MLLCLTGDNCWHSTVEITVPLLIVQLQLGGYHIRLHFHAVILLVDILYFGVSRIKWQERWCQVTAPRQWQAWCRRMAMTKVTKSLSTIGAAECLHSQQMRQRRLPTPKQNHPVLTSYRMMKTPITRQKTPILFLIKLNRTRNLWRIGQWHWRVSVHEHRMNVYKYCKFVFFEQLMDSMV